VGFSAGRPDMKFADDALDKILKQTERAIVLVPRRLWCDLVRRTFCVRRHARAGAIPADRGKSCKLPVRSLG
jgi:hypothetical protein